MKITIETPEGDYCAECPLLTTNVISQNFCRYFRSTLGRDGNGTTKCPKCLRDENE